MANDSSSSSSDSSGYGSMSGFMNFSAIPYWGASSFSSCKWILWVRSLQ